MSVPSSGGLSCHLNKVIVPVASRLQVLPPTHRIKGLAHAHRLQLVECPPRQPGPCLVHLPPLSEGSLSSFSLPSITVLPAPTFPMFSPVHDAGASPPALQVCSIGFPEGATGPAWAAPQSRTSPAVPRESKDRLSWKPIKLDILQHNNDLFTSGSRVHHDSVCGGVGQGLSPHSHSPAL